MMSSKGNMPQSQKEKDKNNLENNEEKLINQKQPVKSESTASSQPNLVELLSESNNFIEIYLNKERFVLVKDINKQSNIYTKYRIMEEQFAERVKSLERELQQAINKAEEKQKLLKEQIADQKRINHEIMIKNDENVKTLSRNEKVNEIMEVEIKQLKQENKFLKLQVIKAKQISNQSRNTSKLAYSPQIFKVTLDVKSKSESDPDSELRLNNEFLKKQLKQVQQLREELQYKCEYFEGLVIKKERTVRDLEFKLLSINQQSQQKMFMKKEMDKGFGNGSKSSK